MSSKILVLTGLSGAGKDSVAEQLKQHGFISAVPHTTRPMREGESEGNPYHFVSKDTYKNMLLDDDFVESNSYQTKFNGVSDVHFYGTSRASLTAEGKLMLTVGFQSALRFKNIVGDDAMLVYLQVNDKERERRAKARGSFDQIEWDNRLSQDLKRRESGELRSKFMDYSVDNTLPIETTVQTINSLYEKNNKGNQ